MRALSELDIYCAASIVALQGPQAGSPIRRMAHAVVGTLLLAALAAGGNDPCSKSSGTAGGVPAFAPGKAGVRGLRACTTGLPQ